MRVSMQISRDLKDDPPDGDTEPKRHLLHDAAEARCAPDTLAGDFRCPA